jgi:hypothetical protein
MYSVHCDTVSVTSATQAVTVPGGAFIEYLYMDLNYSGTTYTGTITLPTNPVTGQTVIFVSPMGQPLYHKYTTSPRSLSVDTSYTKGYSQVTYMKDWKLMQ